MNLSNTDLLDPQETELLENQPSGNDPDVLPEYLLHISRDRVSILLDCPNPHSETDDIIQRILADFKTMEIPEYPDAEILKSILKTSCAPGQNLFEHTIMMGQAVTPSVNGRLEWSRDFFAEGWEIDEKSGAIDFWAKCESRSVKAGELLVCLHHPVEGVPGLNVFGNEIPVTKPNRIKLRAGKNVGISEEENTISYSATCNGRVRFADGTVSVDDVYNIKGDVNLETGNVVHTGSVMIQGDVGVGATLEVEGDIIVKGMLEPCHIKCGGSLTVAGGIVGEKDYAIAVAEDLIARYITEASLEIGGNILVGNEISHSNILCLGKIKVPKGRIAGGTSMALKGIRVSEAGASGSSVTHLIAGVDFTLKGKTQEHNENILKLEKAQEKIDGALTMGRRKRNATSEELQSFDDFKRKLISIGQAIADEHMIIQKLKVVAVNEALEEVVITKELWSGTTIQLGKDKVTVRDSVLKPRIALKRKRKVVIGPLGDANMPEE